MTTKRFTIKPSMIVDDVTVIIDNQKEYTFPVLDSTLNYMFCKVLNEQHETIQRLKQNITELLSVDIEEELLKENEQLKTTIQQLRTDNTKQKKLLNTTMKENEQLKCGNKNLKATLNDFINILNRLQSNPNNEQTLNVARDMLQNMGKEL